ncbi:allantoicase [Plantactinospora sp. S1510]|uniref:Probable allantoicase n=1 Tax=Plantactinospora alkalitolerans TaxID=2789879 RepID=A0ABS0GPH8_9ACTN|nr:allantoicase [Plantactinospora alkalitolerans]MBF9128103.1 allantoicase [Plantactinospora alkalitolerans]
MTGFTDLPDLASRGLGGGVVDANDEFFAARDNLVTPEPPTFAAGTFGPKGQVYDGWETRRRRDPGHDYAILRLGAPGIVRGVVVDTSYFTGNYPPYASVEACGMPGYPDPAELADADWLPLLARSPLRGDSRNLFEVDSPHRFTHVRLRIYPDGGVARLRVHGIVVPDPELFPDGRLDLAALEHGGLVVGCSDMFYGSPQQLLAPGLARSMGEGWETARRRDDGNDWVRVRLAVPGQVRQVELDTSHFKGNAPAAATLRGIDARSADPAEPAGWFEILPRTRLQPDTRHRFPVDVPGTATDVRLDVFPDGGLARMRLPGRVAPTELGRLRRRWSESLPLAHTRRIAPSGSRRLGAWGPAPGG